MSEIVQLPDNNSGNGNLPFSIPIGGGNGLFGNGSNTIGDLIGLAIVASIFGWNNGGGFGGWGGNAGGAGFLSNQLNNDSGRELIMNAINSNGEASRSAIQNLATMLGQDYNTVFAAVQNVQSAIATLAAQQGMSTLQVVNAIQSGDAALASQFQKCCCDNQLAICQQTNALQSQADRNTNSLMNAIAGQNTLITKEFCDLKERELQNKIDAQGDIITQLRGQIDNANQSNQIIGYINSVIAPLQTKLTEIAGKIPNTVPVQYPNLVAVNNTPYNGGYYGIGMGNGFSF